MTLPERTNSEPKSALWRVSVEVSRANRATISELEIHQLLDLMIEWAEAYGYEISGEMVALEKSDLK
jgi:hypothetical protein